jgi:TRAP-type C4-dicarboxylate transport system permease small subunit
MRTLRAAVERLAFAVLLVGGVGVLISMFLGTADVVGTQFFGRPVTGALELTESTMVLVVFGALAYAQIRRGHIRVELLYTHVPPRGRAALDFFTHVIAIVFYGLLLWLAIDEAMFSWSIGEATVGLIRVPLFPARSILVAGTALMIVQLLLDLVLDVRRVMGRERIEDIELVHIPDVSALTGEREGGR